MPPPLTVMMQKFVSRATFLAIAREKTRRAPSVSWGVLQFVFFRVSDGGSIQRRSTIGLTPDARQAVSAHGNRRVASVSWRVLRSLARALHLCLRDEDCMPWTAAGSSLGPR